MWWFQRTWRGFRAGKDKTGTRLKTKGERNGCSVWVVDIAFSENTLGRFPIGNGLCCAARVTPWFTSVQEEKEELVKKKPKINHSKIGFKMGVLWKGKIEGADWLHKVEKEGGKLSVSLQK